MNLHVVGHTLDVDPETDGTLVPRIVVNDHVLVFIFSGLGQLHLFLLLEGFNLQEVYGSHVLLLDCVPVIFEHVVGVVLLLNLR